MNRKNVLSLATAGLVCWAIAGPARADEPPKVQIPDPGVRQIMTLQGRYVRAAYNGEGYAILGYKLANLSVGETWLLLEAGFALREGMPDYDLTREALSLETPDGKTVPLPTISEFRKADTRALKMRERVQRDSINYFPPNAHKACSVQFFTDIDSRAMPWDKVELSNQRACLGRLYFPVEGGITYGQYWLNVKFAKSLVRVPFRILTKEEEKLLEKNFDDIKKQVDEAFRPKPAAPAGKK
jgi:hypothetical protein